MPRRNRPIKNTPFVSTNNENNKTRYDTKQKAEKAAELRMLENMNLELTVYRGNDGGWYLTSRGDNY
ncbi:MAG: hypothetical protein WAW80_03880 [Candidatus Saccharimonadales bacterium]